MKNIYCPHDCQAEKAERTRNLRGYHSWSRTKKLYDGQLFTNQWCSSLSLVGVVLLVEQHLVIDDRRDCFAGKESSVEAVFGLLRANALLELDKYFHQNLGVVRLVLLLLVEG